MLRNYLKAYLRNLWKNRTYTFLNIISGMIVPELFDVALLCCSCFHPHKL